MWSCQYCGNHLGMVVSDKQMSGVICLHPDCGRVEVVEKEEMERYPELFAESDL